MLQQRPVVRLICRRCSPRSPRHRHSGRRRPHRYNLHPHRRSRDWRGRRWHRPARLLLQQRIPRRRRCWVHFHQHWPPNVPSKSVNGKKGVSQSYSFVTCVL